MTTRHPTSRLIGTHATYDLARDTFDYYAKCTATFGYPGQGGYAEYWRAADGTQYCITNGAWDTFEPRVWTVEQLEDRDRG